MRPNCIVLDFKTHTKSNKRRNNLNILPFVTVNVVVQTAFPYSFTAQHLYVSASAAATLLICKSEMCRFYPVEAVSSTWLLWFCPTHLQYVLPSWFVVFTLKLALVWKCPFGPSPWHLWVWSPCHFGFKYGYLSWRTIGNILFSQWVQIFFSCFFISFFFNTNCINISCLEICYGDAHLVMHLSVPVYTESPACLFPLACLSHTAWL